MFYAEIEPNMLQKEPNISLEDSNVPWEIDLIAFKYLKKAEYKKDLKVIRVKKLCKQQFNDEDFC